MGARYETHLLIDELQREKILETQAKQAQAVSVTQEVRSKPPTKLKTIDQLKATDRPADVKAKLQERAQEMLRKLCANSDCAKHLRSAMPGHATQRIRVIGRCEQAIDAWMRDVTASATQIVEKYKHLRQEHITLQTRYNKLVFLPLMS